MSDASWGGVTQASAGDPAAPASWLPRAHLQHLLDLLLARGYRVLGPVVRDAALHFDAVVAQRGTQDLARDYLEFLYSGEAQTLGAQLAYRPTDPAVAAKFAASFPQLELVTVESIAGSWPQAVAKHFADGASFDQIYVPR